MTVQRVLSRASLAFLAHGEASAFLRSLPDGAIDALVTDPPYSSGGLFASQRVQAPSKKYVQSGTLHVRPEFLGETMDQEAFFSWAREWLLAARLKAKPFAILCAFIDWRQVGVLARAVQAAGWTQQGLAVWDKTPSCRPRKGGFRSQGEFLVWGTNGPLKPWPGAPCLPGVIPFPSREKTLHIAQKPEALMSELVKLCPPGGVIVDPFAGSGTTAVAALRSGRRFLGAELHPEIHARAHSRIDEAD